MRSTGVAHDRREIVSDVACIAAPVFDDDGNAVAAVSISMPFYRFEPRRAAMIEPLKTAAKEVSPSVCEAKAEARAREPSMLADDGERSSFVR